MDKLSHIIYKITNLLNEMFYVGKHSTTTPYDMKGYWSSSPYLKNVIKKYGKENFKREILFVFGTEEEAYKKEEEIVTLEYVARKDIYNLKVGGKGFKSGKNHPCFGTHSSEETKKLLSIKKRELYASPEGVKTKQLISNNHVDVSGLNNPMYGKRGKDASYFGRHHTEESKRKSSISHGLTDVIKKQRLEDIKNIEKVWGWMTRLSVKWGRSVPAVRKFIKNHVGVLIVFACV